MCVVQAQPPCCVYVSRQSSLVFALIGVWLTSGPGAASYSIGVTVYSISAQVCVVKLDHLGFVSTL